MMDNDGHAHEHRLIEIADTETITVYEESPHEIITLRLHERGISIDLTIEDARQLSEVMLQVGRYLQDRPLH